MCIAAHFDISYSAVWSDCPRFDMASCCAGAQPEPGDRKVQGLEYGQYSLQGAPSKPRQQVANMPQQTGDTIADVKQLIETSDSHSALLRELLFTSPENGGTGKVREGASSDPLVSEVKAEILQVWSPMMVSLC
jgi:hypothetical protein